MPRDEGYRDIDLDSYVRVGDDILFDPNGTIQRVEREYEQRVETDSNGQTGLESQEALAQIEQVSEHVRE